jgi:hypothetical protein
MPLREGPTTPSSRLFHRSEGKDGVRRSSLPIFRYMTPADAPTWAENEHEEDGEEERHKRGEPQAPHGWRGDDVERCDEWSRQQGQHDRSRGGALLAHGAVPA